jgi:hypothetical protein
MRMVYAVTDRIDTANHLMAGNDRIGDVGQFPVDDMQVGAANATGAYLDADLAWPRKWVGPLRILQPRASRGQDHGVHDGTRFGLCPSFDHMTLARF